MDPTNNKDQGGAEAQTGFRCSSCYALAGQPHVHGCPEAGLTSAVRKAIDMLAQVDVSKVPLAVSAAIGVLRAGLADQDSRAPVDVAGIRALVTPDPTSLDQRVETSRSMPTGHNFVFESGTSDFLTADLGNRRFAVIDDDPAESAYWRFDARKKGYSEWKGRPQTERDAFKAEYRAAFNQQATEEAEGDAKRFAKLLQLCTEAKPKFGPKNEIRAMTMSFKTSVETSIGYRVQLRKLVDDMTPASGEQARRDDPAIGKDEA